MKVSLILAVVLIGLVHLSPAQVTRLPIQIYYGALCPDSIRFVQEQLNPIYPDIQDYVTIYFVPFGKAASTRDDNDNVSFTCQQGPTECDASRVQLCAMDNAPDYNTDAAFVGCQMAFNADQTGVTCANQANIPVPQMNACINSNRSEALLLQAEFRTNLIPLTWVPTVTYNWVYDQVLTDRSEVNLLSVVCEQLNNAAPICNQ